MMAAHQPASRRLAVVAIASVALAALLEAPGLAEAQGAGAFPSRPLRLLIPYTPGGPTDYVGRYVGQRLSAALLQPVVVDNRGGGGGVIAVDLAARAQPDGHTMLLATPGQLVILPLLANTLPFDTYRDLMPVTKLVDTPQVLLASAKFPPSTLPELIAHAKQRPEQILYGSVQAGGSGHLGMERLSQLAGIRMVHVPYKGTVPAVSDMLAGRISLMFSSLPSVQGHVLAGRLKIIATGAPKRTEAIREVPTIAETVPGFDLVPWYGLFVPRATPAPALARLHAEVLRILQAPETAQAFAAQGVEPAWSERPQALEQLMRAESERWRKVIATAAIRLE